MPDLDLMWLGLARVSTPIELELGTPAGPAQSGPALHTCLVMAPNAASARMRCLAAGVEASAEHLERLAQAPSTAPGYLIGWLLGGARLLRPSSPDRVLVWPAGGGPVVLAEAGLPPRRVSEVSYTDTGWRLADVEPPTPRGGGTGAGRPAGGGTGDLRVRSTVYLDQGDDQRIKEITAELGVVEAEAHRQVVKAGLAARDGHPWQPRLAELWDAALRAQRTLDTLCCPDPRQMNEAELGMLAHAKTRRDALVLAYELLTGADPARLLERLQAETGR